MVSPSNSTTKGLGTTQVSMDSWDCSTVDEIMLIAVVVRADNGKYPMREESLMSTTPTFS